MSLFRRRQTVEAARQMPDTPPCATASCAAECLGRNFRPREVNRTISETISNAPARYAAWNGTYGWQSKYMLTVNRSTCGVLVTMRLKITGTITDAQKAAWKAAIEARWNGKVKFVCPDTACPGACGAGYPVRVEVHWVTSNEHYTITANNPAANEGGRSGLGGTTSMTGWGVDDTVDITHEFGHMLGAPEEYFTTNGIDHTHGGTCNGFRDAGGGNMNNPSHDPLPPNYDLIRQEAVTVLGRTVACTTQPQ
jgi:hypothetical protein